MAAIPEVPLAVVLVVCNILQHHPSTFPIENVKPKHHGETNLKS